MRRGKKQTKHEQQRKIGLFGKFYFVLFSPNTHLSPRDNTWLLLRKTEVRPMNTPHFDVCTCGKISGHTSPTESGGQSPAHIQRRLTCSNIHFPLLTTSIKPSETESTRLWVISELRFISSVERVSLQYAGKEHYTTSRPLHTVPNDKK